MERRALAIGAAVACRDPGRPGSAAERDTRRTSLQTFRGGAWRGVAGVGYRAQGRGIEIAIPRAALGRPSEPLRLDFKRTGNTGSGADALNLYSHGDAAPNGRFAYPYRAASRSAILKGRTQQ